MKRIYQLSSNIYNVKKIVRYYLLDNRYSGGFTLIELLVVMVVVIAVGSVVSGILVSALRGSNKSKAINNLENNGNYVISQVSKMVRFAKKFDGISDGTTFTTNCAVPTPGAGTPTPTPKVYSELKITSYDGNQTTFTCGNGTISSKTTPPDNSSAIPMIDEKSVTMTSCTFTCEQSSPSDYPTIGIKFTLTQYQPTSGMQFLPENTASADFQTAVSPRNLHR